MIISDEQALRASCAETPYDDAPWLVYADWLRDHGRWEDADRVPYMMRAYRVARDPARFLPRALPVAERLDE